MLTATDTNSTGFSAQTGTGYSASASRTVIVISMAAGLAVALLAGSAAETSHAISQAGPDLTRLLRAMAALKTMMAAGAVAALFWRLGTAAGPLRLAAYATTCAAMAAGPALIWQMAHVGAGALLLHGGLLACALLLWRDPATAAMLKAAVARRRALA